MGQQSLEGKPWYSIFAHPLIAINISDTRNLLPYTRSPLRNHSVFWEKKLLRVSRDSPSLPLIQKSFRCQKFSKVRKRSFTELFGIVRQNNCDEKSWYSLSYLQCLLISAISWKKRRIPIRSSSVLWDKKFFTRNPENTTFLLSMRFFDNKNFLKSGGITLRSFSVLWGNIISTGNCDAPTFLPPRPLIFKKNRPHQNFSKLVKGSFTNFFGTVTKTNWKEHCDTPLLSVT